MDRDRQGGEREGQIRPTQHHPVGDAYVISMLRVPLYVWGRGERGEGLGGEKGDQRRSTTAWRKVHLAGAMKLGAGPGHAA